MRGRAPALPVSDFVDIPVAVTGEFTDWLDKAATAARILPPRRQMCANGAGARDHNGDGM
jgi:hypothetical protein